MNSTLQGALPEYVSRNETGFPLSREWQKKATTAKRSNNSNKKKRQ
jgi:hypothetical protein